MRTEFLRHPSLVTDNMKLRTFVCVRRCRTFVVEYIYICIYFLATQSNIASFCSMELSEIFRCYTLEESKRICQYLPVATAFLSMLKVIANSTQPFVQMSFCREKNFLKMPTPQSLPPIVDKNMC